MAKKEDRKKQKKRLKERKNAAKRAQFDLVRVSRSLYPSINIVPEGGDPAFVSMVQELVEGFDFNDPSCCNDIERNVFKEYHQKGFMAMHSRAEALAKEAPQAGFAAESARAVIMIPLVFLVGNWIFSRLPDEVRNNALPTHYFKVMPHDRDLYVFFKFLTTASSKFGTIYCPPTRPAVSLGGGHWRVAFSRHAIERVCERICPKERPEYRDFSLCETYFRTCVYYEPLELPNGDYGIRLFHTGVSAWGGKTDPYINGVLGLDRHPGKSTRLYRVLGYCPVAFVGARAVALTFLCPGFRNTPEHALVESADIPTELRQRLRTLSANNTAQKVYSEQGVEALKWYHDNGIPQVLELSQKVFSNE